MKKVVLKRSRGLYKYTTEHLGQINNVCDDYFSENWYTSEGELEKKLLLETKFLTSC